MRYLNGCEEKNKGRGGAMKIHLWGTMLCVTAFLWCPSSTEAAGSDWKILQESTYGDTWYYDAASVRSTENNTILVRTRTKSAEHLYEIDCKNRKARLLEGIGATGAAWFNIVGGDELLYHAVCP